MFRAIAVATSFLVTLATAEGLLRVVRPTPRIQIVRAGGRSEVPSGGALQVRYGAPLWPGTVDAERHNTDCAQDTEAYPRILVLGSSIFAANDVPASGAFSVLLQARLRARGLPACVSNLAEGAYTFQNQRALAEDALRGLAPDLVIWELWQNSPQRYSVVGGQAYRFQDLRITDGLPNPLGMPSSLHTPLFVASRFYEFFSIAFAGLDPAEDHRAWERLRTHWIPEASDRVQREGSDLLWAFCPQLDRSFEASVADRAGTVSQGTDIRYRPIREALQALGDDWVHVEDLLVGQDVEALRMDTCCHFNAQGQVALAAAFEPIVMERLANRDPPEAITTGDTKVSPNPAEDL